MAMSTETLFDLLDIYTQHRSVTIVGREHSLNNFLGIRIILNLEASANAYPRYAQSMREKASSNDEKHLTTGGACDLRISAPKTVLNSRSVFVSREDIAQEPQCQQSAVSVNSRIKDLRFGKGTVRYLLNPERAREEKRAVAEFFGPAQEKEEYDARVEQPAGSGERRRERGDRRFERDGQRRWAQGGEHEGGRRRV